MQFSLPNKEYPYDIRLLGVSDEWGMRWQTAMWELENLAHFNQSAYAGVDKRNEETETIFNDYKRIELISVEQESDDAYFKELRLGRMRQTMMINDDIVEKVARYADEVTIIAVWAFIEKHLNFGLTTLQKKLNLPQTSDHRWPSIEQAYLQCGIKLSQLSGFEDANECRLVNNALKHAGMVSQLLGDYPAFAGKVDLTLDTVILDVQRYYFAAGDFTSAAMERCSQIAQQQLPFMS